MKTYVARRLLWLPIVLLAVSFITFALGHYGPGDPVSVLAGQHRDPEVIERIRHQRGLDDPFIVQYGRYIFNAFQGDLGESFAFPGQPVGGLIAKKIWISAQLGIAATIVSLLIGTPLGLIAALNQGRWIDPAIVSGTLFFLSVPVLLTAPVLLLVFVIWLDILPSSGWGGFFDTRIIMPALVMGLPGIAVLTRLMRASTLDIIGQDYIRTARSKGLGEFLVRRRHILRNALIPIVTVVGLSLGDLVTGAFITEGLFGIPGVGRLVVNSIFERDYPVIMAVILLVAVSFVIANLLVDILYAFLDPRIRYH
ncbi:MAG: ABC transporter permease [Dehalococcoidia bacterium]